MLVSGVAHTGQTSIALNLAAGLVQRGRKVLLVDENPSAAAGGDDSGHERRADIRALASGVGAIDAMLTRSRSGHWLLSLAPLIEAWPEFSAAARARITAELWRLESRCDMVLIDTAQGCADRTGIFDGRVHDTIVIAVPAAAAVTAAYALSKKLGLRNPQSRFHTLLNRVGEWHRAGIMLDNLTQAIRARLHLPVEPLGCVPLDRRLHAASLCGRLVVEASPASPAAVRLRGMSDAVASWSGVHAGAESFQRIGLPLPSVRVPVAAIAGA